MKIAVALSGGVDSTTVAQRLMDQGHKVVGLTMQLCPDFSNLETTGPEKNAPSPCACLDGRAAARLLGIRHELVDFRDVFESRVIKPFLDYFSRGWTPNPCAFCNRAIKFGMLLDYALAMGVDALATGHYADLDLAHDPPVLRRAQDKTKDQTYFLAWVPQARFAHVLFPLSRSLKQDVTEQAAGEEWMRETAATSNEICFLRNMSHIDFLRHRIPEAFMPGDIVDTSGKKLGRHQGVPHYTIGQRRGIGVAARQPLYVVALDMRENRVMIGEDRDLLQTTLQIDEVNWAGPVPTSPQAVEAMIRYRQKPKPAQLRFLDQTRAVLTFEQPVRAVTPGQVAAFYQQDRLMGGGMIRMGGEIV